MVCFRWWEWESAPISGEGKFNGGDNGGDDHYMAVMIVVQVDEVVLLILDLIQTMFTHG